MVGHGGSSASSYLADPTSPIPSHCASIVVTSTLRVKYYSAVESPIGVCCCPHKSLLVPMSACCPHKSLLVPMSACCPHKSLLVPMSACCPNKSLLVPVSACCPHKSLLVPMSACCPHKSLLVPMSACCPHKSLLVPMSTCCPHKSLLVPMSICYPHKSLLVPMSACCPHKSLLVPMSASWSCDRKWAVCQQETTCQPGWRIATAKAKPHAYSMAHNSLVLCICNKNSSYIYPLLCRHNTEQNCVMYYNKGHAFSMTTLLQAYVCFLTYVRCDTGHLSLNSIPLFSEGQK